MKTYLSSIGHYHPENDIKNSFFDQLGIGSDAQWVAERTGIESRRSVLAEESLLSLHRREKSLFDLRNEGKVMTIAEMGKKAWDLLKSRTDQAEGVDTLFCGTSVPDFDIPANACTIGAAIRADCFSADVNSACSSFVVNLHAAAAFLKSKQSQKVAVFIPERYSLRLDYNDKASCVLFGDGCASALLQSEKPEEGFELVDTIVTSQPEKYDLVQIPVDKHFFQNGKAVQKFAISRTIEITQEILRRNDLSISDANYLIGHQANLRMLTAAMNKLDVSEDKHLFNVNIFGNQGGAGAPCVMSQNYDKFKSGDLIVVSVVGSGLTWASALLRRI